MKTDSLQHLTTLSRFLANIVSQVNSNEPRNTHHTFQCNANAAWNLYSQFLFCHGEAYFKTGNCQRCSGFSDLSREYCDL